MGHQGAPRRAPGNTLEAIEAALTHGADAVEVDVRATADDELVLHHDKKLAGKRVDQLELDRARKLARQEGFELATLRQVLERFDEVPLDVELKKGGISRDAADLLRDHRPPDSFIISSFWRSLLSSIGDQERVRTGWLLSPFRALRLLYRRRRARHLDRWTTEALVDALVIHKSFLRLGLLRAALAVERPIVVWTVNRDRQLRKLLEHPFIAGVITDRVARASHLRRVQQGPTTPAGAPTTPVA